MITEQKTISIPTNATPLTIDELREMDGQPVFLETGMVDIREQLVARWEILVEHDESWFCFTRRAGGFPRKNYGKTWLAYRYVPNQTAKWVEYTGEDSGFHYCSRCKRGALNYDDGGEVVEILSDFCPHCGQPMKEE